MFFHGLPLSSMDTDIPRPRIKAPGPRSGSRLSCSAGRAHVCGVVGAWPVQFPCLALAVETPRQNNTLCFPGCVHLRISKHFADIKRTLPAHSAAGEHGCSRGESLLEQRGAFAFSPGEAMDRLKLHPMASWALQGLLLGKSLPRLPLFPLRGWNWILPMFFDYC